jgi:hypothetical protein
MKPKKLLSLMAPVFAAALMAGCNSSDEAGSVSGGGAQLPSGTVVDNSSSTTPPTEPADPATPTDPTPPAASGVVGPSCVSSDANKICLAVHFVTYTDSSGKPTATQDQAINIINTMNSLFGTCNIGFQIENYDPEDPTKLGLAYGAQSQNQLDQIRQAFAEPSDMLLGVTTGPWGTAVNGWTNMPGSGVYGAIVEASVVDYGGGIIHAHEFGHYLGLDHVSDSSDLMSPVIYTSSTKLTSSQCQTARSTATSYWAAMVRK